MKITKSLVLTCLGACGFVSTVALAVKATPEAEFRVANATYEKNLLNDAASEEKVCEELSLTTFEVVKETWRCYVPTAIVGAASLACFFGANVLNRRQQAALVSGYALLDKARKEYLKKIDECTDEEVLESIPSEKLESYSSESEDGIHLFYDMARGCYMESTLELFRTDDGLECFIVDLQPTVP